MKVISIDPSLNHTGIYSVGCDLTDGKRSATINPKGDRVKKLGIYAEFALANLKNYEVLVIEDYAFASHDRSVTAQAEVGGVFRGIAAFYGLTVIEVPIQTWKAIIGVRAEKGTKQKDMEYLDEVFKVSGTMFGTTHEADAFMIYEAVKRISNGNLYTVGGAKIADELAGLDIKKGELI